MLVAGLLRIKKFNFQGFIMSKTPQNLPKRTRVLVKDILFQERYKLTHTQVDIMAYIINALIWTTKIGAFFPITNKKFHEDLPQISEKTIEESLRALKAMELIEVQMITVPSWGNAYVRGICILPKGLEYNGSYYQIEEKEVIENLRKQMSAKDQEIDKLQEELESIKAVDVPQNSEQIEKKEEKEAKIIKNEIEKDDGINYDDFGYTELVKTVTKEFGATSEPICNSVKGWTKETTFYINSYNKLTIQSPSGQVAQLKNPIEISDFWKYLYKNKHQIGKVIDFSKKLTLEELNKRYIGMDIALNEKKFKVHEIKKVKNGVEVSLKGSDSGNIAMLSKEGKTITFELEECQRVLLGLRI